MKESMFNIHFSLDGKNYVFNTKNRGLIQIKSNILDSLNLPYLIKNKFIIQDYESEVSNIIKETNNILKTPPKDLHITIQLTEECNYQCIYCYQEHNKHRVLTFSSALKLVKIINNILKKKHFEKLCIHYFGGEPLLNKEILKFLDKHFKNISSLSKISCTSYLTTNASLLDVDIVKSINFETIKITLEGLEENHNQLRKSDLFRFSDLIKNIKNIIDFVNIICIRINLCKQNKDDLESLIDYIMIEFKDNKSKFKFDINQMIKYSLEDKFDMLNYEEYSNYVYKSRLKLNSYGVKLFFPKRIASNCSFLYNRAFSISPELNLTMCSGNTSVFHEEFNEKHLNFNFDLKLDKKCFSCKVLPICLGGCPLKKELGYNNCIPEKLILEKLLPTILASYQKGVDDDYKK